MKILAFILAAILSLSTPASDHIIVDCRDGTQNHGTSFCMDGYVITCAHVVADFATVKVWHDDEWVKCEVVKVIAEYDTAYLKPEKKLTDKGKDGFVCSYWDHDTGLITDLQVTGTAPVFLVTMHGFKPGGSGSPIYKDGKVYGMAYALAKGTDYVFFIPFPVIKANKP